MLNGRGRSCKIFKRRGAEFEQSGVAAVRGGVNGCAQSAFAPGLRGACVCRSILVLGELSKLVINRRQVLNPDKQEMAMFRAISMPGAEEAEYGAHDDHGIRSWTATRAAKHADQRLVFEPH